VHHDMICLARKGFQRCHKRLISGIVTVAERALDDGGVHRFHFFVGPDGRASESKRVRKSKLAKYFYKIYPRELNVSVENSTAVTNPNTVGLSLQNSPPAHLRSVNQTYYNCF